MIQALRPVTLETRNRAVVVRCLNVNLYGEKDLLNDLPRRALKRKVSEAHLRFRRGRVKKNLHIHNTHTHINKIYQKNIIRQTLPIVVMTVSEYKKAPEKVH